MPSDEVLDALMNENNQLHQRVAEMEENLRWCTVVMAVLLQNEGGVLELDEDTIAGIQVDKVNIRVRRDADDSRFVVEGTFE